MERTVLKVLDGGLGASLQDQGRSGWRRFGVPLGGVMDDHAVGWANRLLDNSPTAPVIEMLLEGARFEVLADTWISVTGAEAEVSIPQWRAVRVSAGDEIRFGRTRSGVWVYLAVEDGWEGEERLGSVSVYGRGNLGRPLQPGDTLRRGVGRPFSLPEGVGGRSVVWSEIRNYNAPPLLSVWPGPQWKSFSKKERAAFFDEEWTVSSQSDRAGYRLEGRAIQPDRRQLVSEPIRVGTIQIPDGGQPIVLMRDGPTVGGYPKLAILDLRDISWLAQCRPGTKVRFRLANEAGVKL